MLVLFAIACSEGFESTKKKYSKSATTTGTTTGGTSGGLTGGTTGGTSGSSDGGTTGFAPPPPADPEPTNCPHANNYYDYISGRWRELDMEARQVEALATGGKEAVTAVHARWLVTVVQELAANGAPVGLEYYHNPVPDTDWYFSNDIILINVGGTVCSVDVIAGRENWTQGDPAWIAYETSPNASDWRDPFSSEFNGIGF
jgi:hypothetical protein